MKKILGIVSVFVLTLALGITVFAADELAVNTTSNTAFTYSGTIDGDNVFAVLVQVVDESGNVAVVDSTTVTDHKFSGTITGLTAGGSYTLRVANYDGGSWIEKAFVMPNQSSNLPAAPTQSTSNEEDEEDEEDAEDAENTENTVVAATTPVTSVAPVIAVTDVKAGKKKVSGATDIAAAVENVSVDTVVGENAPAITMNTSKAKLMEASGILTEEEKARIGNGEEAKIWLEVKAATGISDEDKVQIENKVKEIINHDVEPLYIDLSLWKQVGNDNASNVSTPGVKISVTVTIPDSIRNEDATRTRRYSVIRLHDGVAEVLEGVLDENWNFTFETEFFSTYALIYQDIAVSSDNSVEIDSKAASDTGADTGTDGSGTMSDAIAAEKDGFNPIILISLIVVGIIAVIVTFLFKRKLDEK